MVFIIGFASGILQNGGPRPRNGNKTDKAHPPIHPVKYSNNLQGNEKKIYEYIVRHFLACCSDDAKGHETVVDIDINSEKVHHLLRIHVVTKLLVIIYHTTDLRLR